MRHPLSPGWITLTLFSVLTAALPAQEHRELALVRASIRSPAITARVFLGEGNRAAAAPTTSGSTETASASLLATPTLIVAVDLVPRMREQARGEIPPARSLLTVQARDWSRRFLAPATTAPRFACLAPRSFGLPESPAEPLELAVATGAATAPKAPPAEWFLLRVENSPPGLAEGPAERLPTLELAEVSPLDPAAGGLALYPW